MKKCVLIFCAFFLLTSESLAQKVLLEGYVFEDGSQNDLAGVKLSFYDDSTGLLISSLTSAMDGYFSLEIDQNKAWRIEASKEFFQTSVLEFNSKTEEKSFLRMSMSREEGYLLNVNLTQPRDSINGVRKEVYGAELSVVNNTSGVERIKIDVLHSSNFSLPMIKGNHYTILISKDDFLTKRIQSYVDIEGCVLCFEGIEKVRLIPNDSVYQSLSMGTLITEVELLPLFIGQTIELHKVRFAQGESVLNREAEAGIQELAEILKDNEGIVVEIGCHSAAQGRADANLKLTQQQADLMVEFLSNDLGIAKRRLVAVGYGDKKVRNRCKRGVNCSDSEHDENRRVVVRIIDIKGDGANAENEAISKVLSEDLSNQADEPNVLIDDEKNEIDSAFTDLNVSYVDEFEVKPQPDYLDTIVFRQKKEAIVEIVESAVALKKMDNGMDKGTISDSIDIIDLGEGVEEEGVDTVILVKDVVIELDPMLQDTMEYSEVQKVVDDDEGKAKSKVDDFSGYSIVIHFSNFPIPANHGIYDDFEQVESYITREKNVLYMLGAFETFEGAEAYLAGEVKPKIPGAYIVRFVNGKKIKVK